jgi:hypothetical protein
LLGIDDWAWRKGRRYGTILCDLERGKAVDLLPDRSAESTAQWLQTHPGTEIVSRDRASLFIRHILVCHPFHKLLLQFLFARQVELVFTGVNVRVVRGAEKGLAIDRWREE